MALSRALAEAAPAEAALPAQGLPGRSRRRLAAAAMLWAPRARARGGKAAGEVADKTHGRTS